MLSQALVDVNREYSILNAIARYWKNKSGEITSDEIMTLSGMSGTSYSEVNILINTL